MSIYKSWYVMGLKDHVVIDFLRSESTVDCLFWLVEVHKVKGDWRTLFALMIELDYSITQIPRENGCYVMRFVVSSALFVCRVHACPH